MSRRAHLRSECGQAVVIAVMMMTALVGFAAFVIDVGSWFRADRAVQTTADAAALAGAQQIWDRDAARAVALDYANRNGGGVLAADVSFKTKYRGDDTISVTANKNAEGFFSRVFGLDSVEVRGKAAVLAAPPSGAVGVAPFAVDHDHEYLRQAQGCPCFNLPTELDMDKLGPGAFKVLNVDGSRGGIGQTILAGWIRYGYDERMDLGWYYNDAGAKFNPAQIQDALNDMIGQVLLFPVYSDYRDVGANLQWKIDGFVGFRMTGFETRGSSGILYGSFTHTIWEGIQSDDPSAPDYGTYVLGMIE